jgi:hypothetical protein
MTSSDKLKQALEVRFDSDAGDDLSIREYLRALLLTLWAEGEGFSGKRPFGNSGWCLDLYQPLIAAGFVPGTLDPEDGYIVEYNRVFADAFVTDLILQVFEKE